MIPEVRYVRNDGVHLAYQTWGEGPRDLVLLPGFLSHLEALWEHPAAARTLERLGAFARVITFDRRGTGLSDPVDVHHAPDLDTRMSDVGAVMDAAGSERAAVFGISEGGPTAILFAAMHPERTRALVLYGAMARSTYADDHPWLRTADDFVESGQELLLPEWGRGGTVDVASPSSADDPAVVAWYARLERAAMSPGMIASVAAMFYDTDVRAVLPSVRVPTLVVHKRGDRLVNVRSGRYLAEHIPDARYVELDGSSHTIYFERPDDVVDEVEEFLTGTRPPRDPERRLAAVLFTDLVGSTERAAELGDARWRELLERHALVVRAELERAEGQEVKALGDGFLATFDGPARAIRCAVAVRDATVGLGLAMRIGLHCGEIEVVGDDVAGIAVHIAARISALADAGEILVSRTVKDLVAGSGITFESRGLRTLRGVPDEWEVFRVV